MAGYQLNTSTDGSSDWSGWANANEKAWKGYIGVSLNNWNTTGVPSVAEGGILEVGGSIFYFGDTEAITGTPSTANLNYIMATVSSTNVAVSYTTVAPSWIANKMGWYDATEAKRYVGGCGINKHMKWVYDKGRDNVMEKTLDIGDWNMDGTATITIAHGLPSTAIQYVQTYIRGDAGVSNGPIDLDVGSGAAGYWQVASDGLNISLFRNEGGTFDSAAYNETTYNRGWITISYEV